MEYFQNTICVNSSKVKRYKRLFEGKYHCDEVKVVGFTNACTSKINFCEESMVLICIETLSDIVRYLRLQSQMDNSKVVLVLNGLIGVGKLLRHFIRGSMIYCAKGGIIDACSGILDSVASENIIDIKYDEFLSVCNSTNIYCESYEGTKELVLFKVIFGMRKKGKVCLISISGDITLQDVSDIFSWVDFEDNFRWACRYEQKSNIRAFLMWRG